MDEPEVLHRLEEMGYVHVGWDVDPRDWHEDSDAEAVARGVLEGIRVRDDSIVLLHSWPDSTAEALPRILAGLADAGAELVNIEMLMIRCVRRGGGAGTRRNG
jgi:peptidoglycan/xylan/chitin deacetylase (PgdA/CDA1 family)